MDNNDEHLNKIYESISEEVNLNINDLTKLLKTCEMETDLEEFREDEEECDNSKVCDGSGEINKNRRSLNSTSNAEIVDYLKLLNSVPKYLQQSKKLKEQNICAKETSTKLSSSDLNIFVDDQTVVKRPPNLGTATEIFDRFVKSKHKFENEFNKKLIASSSELSDYVSELKNVRKMWNQLQKIMPKLNADCIEVFTVDEQQQIKHMRECIESYINIQDNRSNCSVSNGQHDEDLKTMSALIGSLLQSNVCD